MVIFLKLLYAHKIFDANMSTIYFVGNLVLIFYIFTHFYILELCLNKNNIYLLLFYTSLVFPVS